MTKAQENLIRRNVNIATINKWITKKGYSIIVNHENNRTCLGLYNPPYSPEDIPHFNKYLIQGTPAEVNIYVQGMHDTLKIID